MHVLVTGASGLIGSALVPRLLEGGHQAIRLVRTAPQGDDLRWDPAAGVLDPASLEGLDAVVHLAGENIGAGRWTPERKSRIRESRVRGTALLSEALASLADPPQVLVCASAVGFYGSRGDEVLTEDSPAGSGFLAELCRDWEAAAEPARAKGLRVVHLRFGMVLSPEGGALRKMLLSFRLGLGGRIGDGAQTWSWISLDDVVGALCHALATDGLRGPVNAVSPHPVTNLEFTRTLGAALCRPTPFPMPAFAARLAFGEMADALLLCSARAVPARLQETGYAFRHPDLAGALRDLLERHSP